MMVGRFSASSNLVMGHVQGDANSRCGDLGGMADQVGSNRIH